VQGIPELLDKLRLGDQTVMPLLTTALYDEMHRIAERHLRRERPDHTLQPTALVHEAYLKMYGDSGRQYADRVHFLAVASHVMRQLLIDYARSKATGKRGGNQVHVRIDSEVTPGVESKPEPNPEIVELLDLNRALDELLHENERLARIMEMHYFGGMTAEETAEALAESVHVVRHDLRLARAWLRHKLKN
jgi:RNA polymerase sigma factor (TIGR02999 family)